LQNELKKLDAEGKRKLAASLLAELSQEEVKQNVAVAG
jgi:hypothetical protein